jgi:hypothetical protein
MPYESAFNLIISENKRTDYEKHANQLETIKVKATGVS